MREIEEMETTVWIALGITAFVLGTVYNHFAKKKRVLAYLEKRYGKKPEEREYGMDKIKMLWLELDEGERGIDEITWNDLNMDDVFRRINVCCSSLGEQVLYRRIRRGTREDDLREGVGENSYKPPAGALLNNGELELLERQARYFAENGRERQQIWRALSGFGKRKGNYYVPLFLNNLDSFHLKAPWIYAVLHLLLTAAAVAALLLRTMPSYALLGIVFSVNLCVYSFMKNRYETHLDSAACMSSIAQMCIDFAAFDGNGIFGRMEPFQRLAQKIKRSAFLINVRHQRTYTADFMEMCAMYLMGAFLLDFILFNRMLGLLEKHRESVWEMLLAVGEADMAISIASYRESLPVWCVPEIFSYGRIEYKGVYNPLLDTPVCNDFSLESNCMITGSNASGKSTFMKAVAVNEILAFSIHTCSAKRAVIPRMEVYTSMAVRDDLLAGESYFVREVKSLRRIVRRMGRAGKALIVIDEILRGTNTRERIAASAAILKYLKERDCVVIAASHDTELARILKGQGYQTYYFCEKETEGSIEFDYKIHDGICMQTNAIKLLEYFAFPQEILKDACDGVDLQMTDMRKNSN